MAVKRGHKKDIGHFEAAIFKKSMNNDKRVGELKDFLDQQALKAAKLNL